MYKVPLFVIFLVSLYEPVELSLAFCQTFQTPPTLFMNLTLPAPATPLAVLTVPL